MESISDLLTKYGYEAKNENGESFFMKNGFKIHPSEWMGLTVEQFKAKAKRNGWLLEEQVAPDDVYPWLGNYIVLQSGCTFCGHSGCSCQSILINDKKRGDIEICSCMWD